MEIIATTASALLAALVGGLIAGYFSLKSTQKSFENQKKQQEENENRIVFGLMQALYDEVDTLWDSYTSGAGGKLDAVEDGKPFFMYWPIAQDYFPVYRGNTILISRIDDNDLRKSIVSTYTKASGMIDSLRMNNELVGKVEYWDQLYKQTQDKAHQQIGYSYYERCVSYAKTMKEMNKELKESVTDLLRRLQKKGVLTEKG